MNFYVLDKKENLVTVLNDGEVGYGNAYSAYVFEKLSSYDLLEMTVKADSEELSLIEEEFYIVFKDVNGWKEYTIYEIEDEDGTNFETTIYAELSSSELIDEVVEENFSTVSKDPAVVLENILDGTRWQVGNVDTSIYSSNFGVNTMNMNALEAINEISKSYSCEVRFSYQVVDNEVVGRFVDLYKQFGEDKGKRFEVGKDVTSIKRNINTEGLKTAIIPYSSEITETDEETGQETKYVIDIKDVEWSKAKGDPVDKPKGQNWLGDPEALELWGRLDKDGSKRHRFMPMEFNLDNAESIASMAWVQLGRYTKPKSTYEVDAVDLFAQSNGNEEYEHEKTALGDTIVAIDKNFAKPLAIQTRVVEVERNLFDPRDNKYVFGSSKATFSINSAVEQVEDVAKDIEEMVKDLGNIQANLNGKNKVFRGSMQPEGMKENDIWFRPHPSVSGENQLLVYDGLKWEIHADTSELQDAGRLQFGTIDGAEINVINLTADNITGGSLDLANGLTLKHGERVILGVNNSTGEVELNVSSLKINASPVLTEDDLADLDLKDGDSAYEIAVKEGFKGTKKEWLQSLKGKDGAKGDPGERGLPGASGKDGTERFTWLKYADTPTSGMSNTPDNKTYIGLAHNKTSSTPSTNYSDYSWSLIKGKDGVKGKDGKDTYTWIKYADTDTGEGMSDSPKDKMFIGLAYNKDTPTESANPKDYVWSAMYDLDVIKDISLRDKTEILSGNPIYTDQADDAVVHVGVDGKSKHKVPVGDGRNLIKNSEDVPSHFSGGYQGAIISFEKADTPHEWGDVDAYKITAEKGSHRYKSISRIDNMIEDEWYSYSIYIKNIGKYDALYVIQGTGGVMSGSRTHNVIKPNESKRVKVTLRRRAQYDWSQPIIAYTGSDSDYKLELIVSAIKFEKGTKATDWSPAPEDVENNIQSVNDFDIVSSVGKRNLVNGSNDLTEFWHSYNGAVIKREYEDMSAEWGVSKATRLYTTTPSSGGITGVWSSRDSGLSMELGKKYTYSLLIKNNGKDSFYIRTNGLQGAANPTVNAGESKLLTGTGTRRPDYDWFQLLFIASTGHFDATVANLKVEEGDENTPYTQSLDDISYDDLGVGVYKTNILLSEPLRSVGDVKDRLFRDSDGLWKVERNVFEATLNGSESYTVETRRPDIGMVQIYTFHLKDRLPRKSSTNRGFNNLFPIITQADSNSNNKNIDEGINLINNYGVVRFRLNTESRFGKSVEDTRVNDIKNWLNDNNTTIIAELEEPYTETLSQELQNKLNNIASFKDGNSVYTLDKSDILQSKLQPELHATFKSKGWYRNFQVNDGLSNKAEQEYVEDEVTSLQSQLKLTDEEIRMTVDENYLKKEEFSSFEESVSTQFTQTSEDFNFEFNKIVEQVTELDGETQKQFEEFVKYIRFVDGTIVLGEVGHGTTLHIQNNRISFRQEGNEVAYISDGMFRINRGVFVEDLTVNEHKLVGRGKGRTVIEYVGEG